jgi:hypothetical protein
MAVLLLVLVTTLLVVTHHPTLRIESLADACRAPAARRGVL